MDKKPPIMLTDGGLWNTRRPQHSTETTRALKSNEHHEKLQRIIEFLILYSMY